MTLGIALQDAVSGLRAVQANIQVISSNIANAQTPGYSRETVPTLSQVFPGGGGGVITGAIQRISDQVLSDNLMDQTSIASAATTRDTYFQNIQSLFGSVNGGNTLNDSYSKFLSAMQAVATTPEDPVAQATAVNAGQLLTQSINRMSSGLQTVRKNADNDLNNDVQSVNTALQNVATFNADIVRAKSLGQPVATLEDQRDQALNQVAQYMSIQTVPRQDGSVVVLSPGGTVLADSAAVKLSYQPSGNVNATTTLSGITVNGKDITDEITSGSMGALLKIRDTEVPALTAELNQFTTQLFKLTAVPPPTPPATGPTLNTTNSGLGATNDANHFFAAVDLSGIDNGATIQVNPSLQANPDLLQTGPSGPDPAISQTIVSNLIGNATFAAAGNLTASSTTTLSNYASQMLGQNASAAAAATDNAKLETSLQTDLTNRLSSENGVNLDEELGNLAAFQNAYGASARVITTVQTLFDTLLKM